VNDKSSTFNIFLGRPVCSALTFTSHVGKYVATPVECDCIGDCKASTLAPWPSSLSPPAINGRAMQVQAWRTKPPKCHSPPTVIQTGQESRGQMCGNFQIMMVFRSQNM